MATLILFLLNNVIWMCFLVMVLAIKDNRTIKGLFKNSDAEEDPFGFIPLQTDPRIKKFEQEYEYEVERPEPYSEVVDFNTDEEEIV